VYGVDGKTNHKEGGAREDLPIFDQEELSVILYPSFDRASQPPQGMKEISRCQAVVAILSPNL
jgi:hypothetical protein